MTALEKIKTAHAHPRDPECPGCALLAIVDDLESENERLRSKLGSRLQICPDGVVRSVPEDNSGTAKWKNLALSADAALWDARAFLKQSYESPAVVERITDDLERLNRMREAIEPAGALERPEE